MFYHGKERGKKFINGGTPINQSKAKTQLIRAQGGKASRCGTKSGWYDS